MANWTDSAYKFYGRKEDITRLHDAVSTNFNNGDTWLGHILQSLGVSDEWCIQHSLRGFTNYVGEISDHGDNAQFEFTCEEAWGTCQDFHDKLKELFSGDDEHFGLAMDYYCVEPGCCVYERTEGYDQKYYVYLVSAGENEEFSNEDDLLDYTNNYLGTNLQSYEELTDYLSEHDSELEENNKEMEVYEFDIVDF